MDRPERAIPILPMPPRLPPPVEHSHANGKNGTVEIPDVDELLMTEADAQAVGKFVREFVTTALLPWMERNTIDWNENVRSYPIFWTFSADYCSSMQRVVSLLDSSQRQNDFSAERHLYHHPPLR
jgi:ER-Golgi trafficking TRAPP I complex 85 kDa subunit